MVGTSGIFLKNNHISFVQTLNKEVHMRKFSVTPFILIISVIFSLGLAQNSERIIFLNLKMVKGQVFLKNVKIVPGKLKRKKRNQFLQDNLYYTVLSTSEKKLYQNGFVNPTILFYESDDKNGMFSAKKVELDSVNFSVKLPYDAQIHKVNFYKTRDGMNPKNELKKQAIEIGSIVVKMDSLNTLE